MDTHTHTLRRLSLYLTAVEKADTVRHLQSWVAQRCCVKKILFSFSIVTATATATVTATVTKPSRYTHQPEAQPTQLQLEQLVVLQACHGLEGGINVIL